MGRVITLASLFVLASGTLPASAQPASGGTAAPLAPFVAREMERLALLDLRSAPDPGPGDFAIAHELLGLAQNLDPGSLRLARRRAEAAWNAGREDWLQASTRRIVELDPGDTVAQLRLITARIRALQTVEERLATYDAFLGERGQGLDPAVRSRLALDAALLHRERGEESAFVESLKQALKLDSTNKDAALLAYTYFGERVDDLRGRVDLLSNLLLADPLDSRTIRALRDVFASAGAFRAASRFHALERQVTQAAGTDLPPGFEVEGFLLDWAVQGPQSVSRALTVQVESERARVSFAGEADPGRTEDPNALRPDDIRLDLPYEQIRVLTLAQQGEEAHESLIAAVIDLEHTVQNRIQSYSDPIRRPQGMSEAEASGLATSLLLELHMLRLMVNVEQPAQIAELDTLLGAMTSKDPRYEAAMAWKKVRDGHAAEIAGTPRGDSPWADIARAEALAVKGDAPASAKAYASICEGIGLNLLGMWSWARCGQLGGDTDLDARLRTMESYSETIPRWINDMVSTPRLTQALTVEVDKNSLGAIDFQPAHVRLRNLSAIPMGLGSGRTMNTRLFFGPMLQVGPRARSDQAVGEVVELDRALRLKPGESVEVDAWPEAGLVGYLAEVGADKPSRLRWRVIQGFETRRTGDRQAGPGSVEAATPNVTREALPEALLSMAKLVARFENADDDHLAALLVAARCKVLGGEIGGTPDPDAQPFGERLAQKYPTWSALGRLAAAVVLPPVGMAPSMAPVDEAMRADQDPAVRAVFALTRATSPDDPVLIELTSRPGDLGSAALAHQARLRAGAYTYAAKGPQARPGKAPK